jgi:hypothetical protein
VVVNGVDSILVITPSGDLHFATSPQWTSLNGVNPLGYNIYSGRVPWLLVQARRLKREQAEAFSAYLRKAQNAEDAKQEMATARSIAERYGYSLVHKKAAPPKVVFPRGRKRKR